MSTTVKVEAHLANNKEVSVSVTDGETQIDDAVLQDGESREWHIYDNRCIHVVERLKEQGA